MEKRVLPHIAALFTMFVWGLTFVSTKVLLNYLNPIEILFARTVLGFLALCLLRPRILRTKTRSHELMFALAGLAALGFILLKEEGLGPRFVAGFVIAIAGIALISFQEGPAHASPIGVALCLVAALTWAVYSIIIKRLSTFGYDTIAVTKRVFAWGLVYMVVMLIATGDAFPLTTLAEPSVIGNLVFLGVLASAGCFVTWGYSVEHLGATSASAYIYLQAPITVVWAVILLGEPFTAAIVIGLALVIVGLALSEGFHIRKRAL